jgi:hypothetical protein
MRCDIFLASPAAAFTTGTLLDLTGGHVDEMMALYPDFPKLTTRLAGQSQSPTIKYRNES